MKVSELGEFGLIDLLAVMISDANIDQSSPSKLIIGLGDDAAAWQTGNSVELATVDAMVQDIHFSLDTDLLAGPRLEVPGHQPERHRRHGRGVALRPGGAGTARGNQRRGCLPSLRRDDRAGPPDPHAIIGGNISRSPVVSVTVTIIGSGLDSQMLRRSSARPGDTIAITGHPGSAAAGLEMLKKGIKLESLGRVPARRFPAPDAAPGGGTDAGQTRRQDRDRYQRRAASRPAPYLRVQPGQRQGQRRTHVPIHPAVRETFGERAQQMALAGGEDYELLFTASAGTVERVKAELACPVTAIGKITAGEPGKISLFDAAGSPIEIKEYGWSHF